MSDLEEFSISEEKQDPFEDGDGSFFSSRKEPTDEEALRGILDTAPDDLGAICSLAHIHRQRGEFDKAEALFRQIISLSGANKAAQAVAHCNLGFVSIKRGLPDKAMVHYEEARQLFQMRDNKEGMALTYCQMGNISRKREEFREAEAFYRESLALNKAMGLRERMVVDYTNLGILFFNREMWEQAENLYKRAIEIEEELENAEGIATMLANIGAIAHKRGDIALARQHWEKALGMLKQLQAKQMVMKVQRWLDFLPNP